MNKTEYLKRLESCLKHLPKEDRLDAIHYYEEYFEDMGVDETTDITSRIDPPEAIAREIINNCTEKRIEDQKEKGGIKNSTLVIWMIILGIFASPIAIPLAIVAIMCLFAIIIVIFSLVLAIAAVSVALLVSGIAIFLLMIPAPGFGGKIFCIGCGLICLGVGLLLMIATILFGEVCIRGIAALFKRIFLRKKVS